MIKLWKIRFDLEARRASPQRPQDAANGKRIQRLSAASCYLRTNLTR
jgi:hypothetical protein